MINKRKWNVIKIILFFFILGTTIFSIYRIIKIKGIELRVYSPISTYGDFYDLEKDSVDVIFLGSSHSYTSFCPQEIYNDYGIRSYNLGSSQQCLFLSYYWLEEALKYQHPKAVVLETFLVQLPTGDEGSIRKALEYMKFSSVKAEAISTISQLYPETYSKESFYFSNIRYHERWKELTEDDFNRFKYASTQDLKGWYCPNYQYGLEDYVPVQMDAEYVEWDMDPLAKEYLDKIVALCQEEGIQLILVKTPTTVWNAAIHYEVEEYAETNNLPFYDLNMEELYLQTTCNFTTDYADTLHPNITGSIKLSKYVGAILANDFGITGQKDIQWENSKSCYEEVKKDMSLKTICDPEQYFSMINDPRYEVFIVSKGNCNIYPTSIQNIFQKNGLNTEVLTNSDVSYYAVLDGGDIVEEKMDTYSVLELFRSFREGKSIYNLKSAGTYIGNYCSVIIDNIETAKNQNGINIVVYNKESKEVLDSSWIDNASGQIVR